MKFSNLFIASMTLTMAIIANSQGATHTWDGGGGDNNWSTAANWDSAISATGDTLVFVGTTRLNNTNNFVTTVAGLTFNSGAGAFVIGGAVGFTTINLGGNIDNNGTNATLQTIDLNLVLTGNRQFNANGTARLQVNGIISETGGSRDLTINNGKSDEGTVILAGNNSYTGATIVKNGVLNIRHGNALGTAAGGTTVEAGAALELDGSAGNLTIDAETLSLNGTGMASGGALRNISGNNSWAGAVSLVATARINSDSGTFTIGAGGIDEAGGSSKILTFGGAGNVTVTGAITASAGDMSVVKDGAGKLTLSGTNTYDGGTTISGGVLSISANSNLGNAAGGITISNGATLQTTGGTSVNTLTRALALGMGGATFDLGIPLYLGGAISGGTGITTGGNDLVVNRASGSGNNAIGAIVVNSGRFIVQNQLANINGSSISVGNGAIFAVDINAANTLTNTIAFASGAGLNARQGTLSIGTNATLPSVGTMIFNNDDQATTAITVNGNRALTGNLTIQVGGTHATVGTVTFADVISGSGSGITKTSIGTLTLGNANTYTGATTVNGGTLKAGIASVANTSGAFGNNSAVTLANTAGATLDITGFDTQIGSLTGGGATGGNVTLGAATLTVGGDNTSPAAFGGVISGTGGLTKIGSGVITLSGANTYTGATIINGGSVNVVTISNGVVAGSLGAASSAATNLILGGGTLKYSGATVSTDRNFTLTTGTTSTLEIVANNLTVAGASINTTGGFNKTGTGTLTLSGDNLHTGTTTVAAGTLSLARSGSTLTGGITVNGGTLDVAQSDTVGAVTLSSGTISGAGTLTGTSYSLSNTGLVSAKLAGSVALSKTGSGTATLSGANSYTGTTTVSLGTLLANNTSGSATGTGAVTVAAGAILGGSGTILPTGANGINVTGALAPGASVSTIGNLTLNLGSTSGKVTMASGSKFEFDLGISGADISASGTSDAITLAGAASGDFAFNGNTIDFKNTGTNGFYKLFDTSLNAANTWTGLTVNGSGLITGGLSISNLTSGRTGSLIMGGSSLGGTAGDIYLRVVPEPSAALLAGIGSFFLLRRRRASCFQLFNAGSRRAGL